MPFGMKIPSTKIPRLRFIRMDIVDTKALLGLFKDERFDVVVNLAAQAGVRYSLRNPFAYIESNVMGFMNILECCRHYPVKHLVYASSSPVYGLNSKTPFSEDDEVSSPAEEERLGLDRAVQRQPRQHALLDRKSTRLNSSHARISYAVFCLKKKKSS